MYIETILYNILDEMGFKYKPGKHWYDKLTSLGSPLSLTNLLASQAL